MNKELGVVRLFDFGFVLFHVLHVQNRVQCTWKWDYIFECYRYHPENLWAQKLLCKVNEMKQMLWKATIEILFVILALFLTNVWIGTFNVIQFATY